MLNLAVWFGWHLMVPRPGAVDPFPLILAAACFALLRWARWGTLPVLALAAAAGWLRLVVG